MKLLETKIIKIGEQDYPVKLTMRAMIEFERLSGHSISIVKSIEDITILFYCTVKAGGANMTYEQFMDLIDDKPDSLGMFSDTMIEKTEKKAAAR
jgi:hypothetical protein